MSQFFTLGSQRIGVSAPYLRTAETSVDYAKAFDCVDHSKLWKILKEIGILDHLTFFLRIYAEYIMRNTGLEEAQAGIKIARRNINNLRYADDTTLIAEREKDLKSLLMRVSEREE